MRIEVPVADATAETPIDDRLVLLLTEVTRLETIAEGLDEIFDANTPLLRVLLGILNERKFKRGQQSEDARLHTAIASTNGDPQTVKKNAPEQGAVIDRFIYTCKVNYLTQAESRRAMYAKFAEGRKPESRISFDDLVTASNLVVGNTIKLDP